MKLLAIMLVAIVCVGFAGAVWAGSGIQVMVTKPLDGTDINGRGLVLPGTVCDVVRVDDEFIPGTVNPHGAPLQPPVEQGLFLTLLCTAIPVGAGNGAEAIQMYFAAPLDSVAAIPTAKVVVK